jgi:uncharacterized protein
MRNSFNISNRLILGLVLSLLVISISNAKVKYYNPSFKCDGVKKDSVEYMICTNKELSRLDNRLSNIYNELIQIDTVNKKKIKKEQREWIQARNGCTSNKCLSELYKMKNEKLYKIKGLITNNIKTTIKRIEVSNPDEYHDKAYHFHCVSGDSKTSPITLSKDKDFYVFYTLPLREKVPTQYGYYWNFYVSKIIYDKTTKKQIFLGKLLIGDGRTYDYNGSDLYTYSKDWKCKLKYY